MTFEITFEEAFKAFCDAVETGTVTRFLFIASDVPTRNQQKIHMFNEAGERGLCPIFRHASGTLMVGDSAAVLCIAHANLHRQLCGITWDAIHGLENLYNVEGSAKAFETLHTMVGRK